MGITERLARASSRHPWRTVGAWIAALMLAFACIALLLPGRLTTEGGAAGNPEFRQAERTEATAFPPDPSRAATDIVLVRSERYTVDQPQFRAFILRLAREGQATGKIHNALVFYKTHDLRSYRRTGTRRSSRFSSTTPVTSRR
jgi:hypothetical protein